MAFGHKLIANKKSYEEMYNGSDEERRIVELMGSYVYKFETMFKNAEFIRTFFMAIVPIGAHKMKEMLLTSTQLSDTDSSAASVATLCKMVNQTQQFTYKDLAVTGNIVTLLSEIGDVILDKIALGNMNYAKPRIRYKNEFVFISMIVTSLTKHYASDMFGKEGIFPSEDVILDKKGVHLKTTRIKGVSDKLLKYIFNEVRVGKLFVVEELLKLSDRIYEEALRA